MIRPIVNYLVRRHVAKTKREPSVVHGDLTNEQVLELGKRVNARCPILCLLHSSGCKINSSWSLGE